MKDMKFKVESMALMHDGKVRLVGKLTYPFGMVDHDVCVWLDKESWDKCVRNATSWHSS